MGSIERCIDAWYRRGSRRIPCRVWCEEFRYLDGAIQVRLRDDFLTLLAVYQVAPIRVHLLGEATSLALDAESGFRFSHEEANRPDAAGDAL